MSTSELLQFDVFAIAIILGCMAIILVVIAWNLIAIKDALQSQQTTPEGEL